MFFKLCRAFVERETGIEPASSAWKAGVLPLNYSRLWRHECSRKHALTSTQLHHFSNALRYQQERWWRRLDSNQRRRKPTDLQSAPFSHSGTPPANLEIYHVVKTQASLCTPPQGQTAARMAVPHGSCRVEACEPSTWPCRAAALTAHSRGACSMHS